MAEVFLAKTRGAKGFERLLVVKRMRPHLSHDLGFIKMFVDEANIAVTLTHPNIGRVYELGLDDDTYFIAMEHIPGVDLADIACAARKAKQPIPLEHACLVMSRVCDALGYAHDKRDALGQSMHIVHRDVTPSNIIVGFQGEVKLIDFGIAKARRRNAETQTGFLKGKPRYVAPEQARHERPDHRADIFSAGVVLYELLTNERMYPDSSDLSILHRVCDLEAVPPPSSKVPGLPKRLDDIVARAIAPNVNDRYQSAHELHDDLHAFMCDHNLRSSNRGLSRWLLDQFSPEHASHTERVKRHSGSHDDDSGPWPDSGRRRAKTPPPPATLAAGTDTTVIRAPAARRRRTSNGAKPATAPLPTRTLTLPSEKDSPTPAAETDALAVTSAFTRVIANKHIVARIPGSRDSWTNIRTGTRRKQPRLWSQYDAVEVAAEVGPGGPPRVQFADTAPPERGSEADIPVYDQNSLLIKVNATGAAVQLPEGPPVQVPDASPMQVRAPAKAKVELAEAVAEWSEPAPVRLPKPADVALPKPADVALPKPADVALPKPADVALPDVADAAGAVSAWNQLTGALTFRTRLLLMGLGAIVVVQLALLLS